MHSQRGEQRTHRLGLEPGTGSHPYRLGVVPFSPIMWVENNQFWYPWILKTIFQIPILQLHQCQFTFIIVRGRVLHGKNEKTWKCSFVSSWLMWLRQLPCKTSLDCAEISLSLTLTPRFLLTQKPRSPPLFWEGFAPWHIRATGGVLSFKDGWRRGFGNCSGPGIIVNERLMRDSSPTHTIL